MGITLEPMTRPDTVIPESKTQTTSNTVEKIDISFTEGCCTCSVGVIDIVNSTKVTARLDRTQMVKYYSLFINWSAAVIRAYGGTVVKNTGDGLLFYFPPLKESERARKIEDSLTCAITLTKLHPNINMKFHSESLPDVNYRISLDYGEVSLAKTIDSAALDIFSTTVNICAKMNSVAATNTVLVGGDLYQVARSLDGYCFEQANKVISVADRAYPLYSVSDMKPTQRNLGLMRHNQGNRRTGLDTENLQGESDFQ